MPETQPTPDLACDEARIDWAILNLLIDSDQQRPRAIEELVREHGNQRDALDAVDRLYRAGLIHRTRDDFVFATRAAIRYSQIGG